MDRLGVPEIDGLSVLAEGNHISLLGAPPALLLAVSGQTLPSRGQLRIDESRPRSMLQRGELAGVFFTDPLESPRTVADHLHASAELAGVPKDERDALCKNALERTRLDAFRTTKLEKASAMVRRGAHLAAALATGAGTLVMSDPAAELDTEGARTFVLAVNQATADKRTIVFRGRARVGDVGLLGDRVLVFSGGTLLTMGTPAELMAQRRTFFVRLAGDPRPFLGEVSRRTWGVESLGPDYVRMTLPDNVDTSAAFLLAEETGVVITELLPALPA